MSAMSENEILQAASKGKQVLDALYGLLGVIDQKTGFEQKAADAEARYNAVNQKEIDKKAELEALQKKIDSASEDAEAAKAYADKIVSDAQAQADNTRILARNESGLLIQNAQSQASHILSELALTQSELELVISDKQKQSHALDTEINNKTTELSKVQSDLDAAKDEIRRKFLV